MDRLTKQELLDYVAPCSFLCYTCPGYKNGIIASCSGKLCNYFEGYYEFNDQNLPSQFRDWLPEFEKFYKKLEGYAKKGCPGCRNTQNDWKGCLEGCFLYSCTQEHGVDFCGECGEFPCERATDFFSKNDTLLSGWISGSSRIKEIGIARYFDEKKDVSHYISYKKCASDGE